MREMFTRQEKNFLASLKLVKEDISKELKQSELNKLQEIAQRVNHLDFYMEQLNEYQISEFKTMKQENAKN